MNKLLAAAITSLENIDEDEVEEKEESDTETTEVDEVDEKEETTDKTTKREDELVFYCKITNFDGLKEATSKENHEQWSIKTSRGRVRVRQTKKEGLNTIYDLTFKTKSDKAGLEGSIETTYSIDEDQFNDFKNLSESGMVKDRYFFPVSKVTVKTETGIQDIEIENSFFEVDVFFNKDKTYNENVKIDLEVNEILNQINTNHPDIGDFNLVVKILNQPFKPIEIIVDKEADESEKKYISNLYTNVFLIER